MDEVGEAVESAAEETEKVSGEEVSGPFEVETTDKRRVKVVPNKGFDEANGTLCRNVNQ